MFKTAMLLATLVATVTAVAPITRYAVKDNVTGKFTSVKEVTGQDAATITYSATMLETGWDQLSITTSALWSDTDQAFAAGYLEGRHTEAASYDNWLNLYGPGFVMPVRLSTWFSNNDLWMANQVAANPTDAYWVQVGLSLRQLAGLVQGLQDAAVDENKPYMWTPEMVALLNTQGDQIDLLPALNITQADWQHMTPEEYNLWLTRTTHCSAIIKVTPNNADIFFGHATWSTYNTMLRIYKHYTLNYKNVKSVSVSFSSYPATLSSVDDYYVTDSGLSVIETTNSIFNLELYQAVTPESLLYWVRVMVATRLEDNGEDWVNTFAKYNSGTYNNQWMVLDLKRFTPGKDLIPGTLWIAEQIPGKVATRDVTKVLSLGYWPSYNVPSIESIFVSSGYPAAIKQQGPAMNSYQDCVRAQIFRQRQASVGDMPAMMFIMQYNDYETDPISEGNPVYAIASRGDLYKGKAAQCFGAIDAKVSSYSMFKNGRQVMAYSGPTPQQQPFNFNTTTATGITCRSNGQNQIYDHLWQHFTPQ